MYDPRMVQPMREELTRLGVEELLTPEEVDAKVKEAKGTTLVVVNSICGCAARNARPAVAKALQHSVKPDNLPLFSREWKCQPSSAPAATSRGTHPHRRRSLS
jgi:putative YphP/YqiW family bacilliredoxin